MPEKQPQQGTTPENNNKAKINSATINNVDEKINNEFNRILNKKFNDSKFLDTNATDKVDQDIVNIIKDYPIFADSCKTVCGENGPPFCLITENKLVAPIAFSNLHLAIRSISQDIAVIFKNIGNTILSDMYEWGVDPSKDFTGLSGTKEGEYVQYKGALKPYDNLYYIQNTRKYFIFPLFGITSFCSRCNR